MIPDTPDYHREQERKREKRIRKASRREWIKKILVGGVGVLGLGGYMSFEAQWIDAKLKTVVLNRMSKNTKIKVLHLSDLHFSGVVPLSYLEKALKLGFADNPDFAVITGDFVTDMPAKEELAKYEALLKKFARKRPVFACLGNHDGGAWAAKNGGFPTDETVRTMLARAGVLVLQNKKKEIHIRGQRIDVVGLGDLWSQQCLPNQCLQKLAFGKRPKRNPILLLNHNPDAKEVLASYDWDLMLSGHTHGGQLIIPFENYAPFAPVKDRSFTHGLQAWKGRVIHISRGVGNAYGVRLNCRPEVTMLEITGKG